MERRELVPQLADVPVHEVLVDQKLEKGGAKDHFAVYLVLEAPFS